jgi:hypothetical protein
VAIMQLQTISAVAKGLTRTSDSLFILDEQLGDAEHVAHARSDVRIIKLQQEMFSAISSALNLWSTDASVSDVSTCLVIAKQIPIQPVTGSLRRLQSNNMSSVRHDTHFFTSWSTIQACMPCS